MSTKKRMTHDVRGGGGSEAEKTVKNQAQVEVKIYSNPNSDSALKMRVMRRKL